MRNLTKTIAAVSLLAPASAHPLGIGDIKLHSALNQKLNAEIALILSGNESPSNIKVKLAPPEKFDEAGIPWSYFLSKIQFEAIVKPDGSVVVKLSSNEALSEPFLDFLLEVSWPQGNLYREFTVLVDPPATYNQPVIPVATEAVASEMKGFRVRPAKLPSQDVSSTDSGLQTITEYGPTDGADSLWKVAKNVNSDPDVSVEQMMIALYEANPQAFYKENVNALMAGKVLKVPEQQVVLRLSRKQASSEFYRQVKAWEGRIETKPVVDELTTLQTTADAESGQLKLIAPSEAEVADDIEVVPGEATTASNIEANVSEIQAGTGSDSLSVENQDLKARLEKLEKQMAIMQKMLVLRDEQLAVLQSGQAHTQTIPLYLEQTVATNQIDQTQGKKLNQPTVADTVVGRPQTEPKPQQVLPQHEQAKPEIQQVKPEPKQQIKPSPAPKPQPQAKITREPNQESGSGLDTYYQVIRIVGGGVLGLLGWLWWRKRKFEEEQNSESMFAVSSQIVLPDTDQEIALSDDGSSYDVGTVGESSFLSEFTPSDFDAFETDQSEVDPISEADVYLAYGRYQQAEELMLQAIQDQPDRDECKLKLLEIFYANENKEAFSTYAKELAEAGKKDDDGFWAKVAEMGNEIITDSPLFSTGAISSGTDLQAGFDSEESDLEGGATETVQEADNGVLDIDLSSTSLEANDGESIDLVLNSDLGGTEEISDALENQAQSSRDNEFDFDLSVFDTEQPDHGQEDESSSELADIESLDVDLNSLGGEPPVDSGVADLAEDPESLDFNFSSEESQPKNEELLDLGSESESLEDMDNFGFSEAETTGTSTEDLESLDFNFSSEESQPKNEELLDLGSESEGLEDLDNFGFSEAETTETSTDDFDFNFDLDSPPNDLNDVTIDSPDVNQEEHQVSDLTDMDECETKIDMAKAYIDMGDEETAKSIAEEVMKKGNENQKQEAKEIIERL